MSVEMVLVCDHCRVQTWVGTSNISGDFLYTSEPEMMQDLKDLLYWHQGHPLRFVADHLVEDYAEMNRERAVAYGVPWARDLGEESA
jgi:hypothetical protein